MQYFSIQLTYNNRRKKTNKLTKNTINICMKNRLLVKYSHDSDKSDSKNLGLHTN